MSAARLVDVSVPAEQVRAGDIVLGPNRDAWLRVERVEPILNPDFVRLRGSSTTFGNDWTVRRKNELVTVERLEIM